MSGGLTLSPHVASSKITNINLVLDPRTKMSRGFAFIDFESPDDATAAVAKFNQAELDSRVLTVEMVSRLICPKHLHHTHPTSPLVLCVYLP